MRVKVMKWKVKPTATARFQKASFCSHGLIFRHSLYTVMPSPLSPPQMTKFQPAPCHSPPRSMVIQMLMLVVTHRWKVGMRHMAAPAANKVAARPARNRGSGHSMTMNVSRNKPHMAVNQEAFRLPPMGMYR